MNNLYRIAMVMVLLSFVRPSALWSLEQTYPTTPDSIAAAAPDSIGGDTLQELVVSVDLKKREGNKDIITITKSMREGTRNTGELLGRIPGGFYNPMSTDIQYRGSKNILILIDGVRKSVDFIKRLNPERFDRVNVINMPTGIYADYDAVFDLHTKPLYTGYEGYLLGETVLATGGRNGKGKALKNVRTQGQLVYTHEKFNLDISTGYTFAQQGFSDYFERSYTMNGLSENTIECEDHAPNWNTRYSRYYADLSFDYDINSRHSLSARVSLTPSSNKETYRHTLERTFAVRNITDTVIRTRDTDVRGQLEVLAGLWYRGAVSKWQLNAYLTYNRISFGWSNDVYSNTGFINTDQRDVLSHYFTGGLETTRVSNNERWVVSMSDNFISTSYGESRTGTGERLSQSNDFRNTFDGSVQYQGSERFSIGLNAGFSVFRNSYNDASDTHVSPRAGLQAMLTLSHNAFLRLSYTLTTQYPPLSQLQDYGQFSDSLLYTSGNPHLKPSLNHDVSLSATFFNSLTLEGRYNRCSNAIFVFYSPREGEIPSGPYTFYTGNEPVNGTRDIWSVNLTYYRMLGKHWQLSVSGKVTGYRAVYSDTASSRILPEYNWYVLYQFMGGSWKFYLSGYMMPYSLITPQTNLWSLEDGFALSMMKTFFDNRLLVLGMWYLPVHFSDGKWHGGTSSPSYNIRYWADNQFRKNNMFQISIQYSFNGGKPVKKYNRSGGTVELLTK